MEAVFLKILNMSLSAAAVIIVVLLVRLALRRAPKRWRYLLWIVVAFRLVCPVSFSAPFSILRLTAQQAVMRSAPMASEIAYVPQDIGLTAQPRVYVGTPFVSDVISDRLPAPTPEDSANPMQIWIAVGTAVWCAGIAALLLYGVISYVNLKRRLRGAVLVEQGVFETDAVRAPFILGLFCPKVYLPVGLEGEPLRYVLSHERFHIRHADHAVKLLAFLLLCVHWFNPLVWLAFALVCRDMEMRCDEAVVSGESGITKPYSMALLSFASGRRFPSPSPLCFGETSVKQRIKNVLRWKKPKVWVTACAALLCVIAVAACAANPEKAEKTGGQTGTPWDWTSTVTTGAIKVAEGNGLTLNAEQTAQLVGLLNAVKPEEVVRGRGIPSDHVLDITTGVGYRLRWAGGIIELDFDDAAAAAELYGTPETLGPGVWEIRSDALYAFLDGLEQAQPAPTGAVEPAPASTMDLTPPERSLPSFRNADGAELWLNMSLIELNEQLGTQLAPGYINTLPQHKLSVGASDLESGDRFRPVVELGFYEGWTISEGPGIGATADEIKAYWGEPDTETDPEAFNPTKLYSLSYMLEDGLLVFTHRGDGVIQTINLYASELVDDPSILTPGVNLTCWHGRGDSHIEPFSCFGELYVWCSAEKTDGHYRMAVTASDGTETVLLEGEGSGQATVPAPRIESGALDVTFDGGAGGWNIQINWFAQIDSIPQPSEP